MKERIKFTYSEIVIILAILTVIAIVIWSVVHYCFAASGTGEIIQHRQIEIKELMMKHGPGYLYEIDKGILYLHRDGQRIEIGRDRS